jgi:Flp pilus assembly protein TadD
MALVTHCRTAWHQLGMLGLAACLMIGGCAQFPGGPDALTLNDAKSEAKPGEPNAVPQTRSEIEKATEYWGKRYLQNPRDIKIALAYGRNLRAMGEKQRALAVFQQASIFFGDNRELAGDYGRLALDLDQVQLADRLLAAADDPVHPDWRIVSARGTVLAKQGKYAEALPFYDRALSLAHDQPSILSNLALATAMSGDPARAESLLRRAEAADGASPKIRQNLALVLGLQGKYDEANLIAARDVPMETAAENTSFLRQVVKLQPKAMPSTADKSVDVAEAPPVQSKSSKPAQVADAAAAKGNAAKPAKPERAPVAEPAPASQPWSTAPKQAAAAPASLAWSTDLKQAEAPPAPTPVSVSADEAQKKTKAAADEVTHKDIDLSLRAPSKIDSGSAKKSDTNAILPPRKTADEANIWTANVSAHAKKTKADPKAAAEQVTHREIDLSLRAPAKSDSGPAKKADTDAILPPGKTAAAQSWTPQVGSTDKPAAK